MSFKSYMKSLSLINYWILSITFYGANKIRQNFSKKYIKGNGIEIGAQASPLAIMNKVVNIKYVDRLSPEENSNLYFKDLKCVVIDIIAEADDLFNIESGSVDFIIANHLIEHLTNPVKAILEWERVLKRNGILYLAIPNMLSNKYDFKRNPTSLRHIIQDYKDVQKNKKEEHWREYVEVVRGISAESSDFDEVLTRDFRDCDNRIHMHVFTWEFFLNIFKYLKKNQMTSFTILDNFNLIHGYEIIAILKKTESFNKIKLHRFRNIFLVFKAGIFLLFEYLRRRFIRLNKAESKKN